MLNRTARQAASACTGLAAALWLCGGAAHAREQAVMSFEVEGGANAAAFAWREGADVLVEPDLLAALGIKPPDTADPVMSLRAVKGLAFTVSEDSSAVHIVCTAACYEAHVLGDDPLVQATAPALSGLVLNYDATASEVDGRGRAGALFDAVLLGRASRIEASGLADSQGGIVRLETAWVRDVTSRRLRVRVGDSISRGGAWAIPVRYAGVRLGTDFSLDPGFVTFPTPELSGAAALPSVVNIFIDNTLRQTRNAPAGPFSIIDPPIVAGAGAATLVVTDALGRQQVITQSFYIAPQLLRPGLSDFGVDVGVRRRNYAAASDDYADPFAAFGMRRGFRAFTGEVHAEAQASARTFGATIAGASLFGEAEAGFAVSESARGVAGLTSFGWTRTSHSWSASARIERTDRDFVRLGGLARADDRQKATASLAWSDPWDGSVAINYAQAQARDGTNARAWISSYARQLSRLNVQATARYVQSPRATFAISFSIGASFGGGRSASTQVDVAARETRVDLRAQRNAEEEGGLGWRLGASNGKVQRYDAGISALTPVGEGDLTFAKSAASQGVRASFRGAIASLANEYYVTRPLRDAFALVETPPGMDVMLDNRRVARTGKNGRALVTDLRANEINRLSIDVDQAPADSQIGGTEVLARPGVRGGAFARFAIRPQTSRWIEVLTPSGAAAPAGILLTRADGAQFFTQAGGRAFVAATADAQILSASIDGRACALDLSQSRGQVQCVLH